MVVDEVSKLVSTLGHEMEHHCPGHSRESPHDQYPRAHPPAHRPQELDFQAFAARVSDDPKVLELLLGWVVDVAQGVLREPDPGLLGLELKYNPDRELKLIAKKYSVTPAEMDCLVRT